MATKNGYLCPYKGGNIRGTTLIQLSVSESPLDAVRGAPRRTTAVHPSASKATFRSHGPGQVFSQRPALSVWEWVRTPLFQRLYYYNNPQEKSQRREYEICCMQSGCSRCGKRKLRSGHFIMPRRARRMSSSTLSDLSCTLETATVASAD